MVGSKKETIQTALPFIKKFIKENSGRGMDGLQDAYNKFGKAAVQKALVGMDFAKTQLGAAKSKLDKTVNFDSIKNKLTTKPVTKKDGGMVKKKKTSSSSSGSVKMRNGIAIKGTKFKGIF